MTALMEGPALTVSPASPNYEEVVKKRTVLIGVTLRKPGFTRKVDSNTPHIQTETSRQALAINKVLLTSPALDQIKKLDNRVRTDLRRMALPDETIRSGWYLVSKDMVAKIDGILADYQAEREGHVAEFKSHYWQAIKDAEQRLKGLFNWGDYPGKEDLDSAFEMSIDVRDTIPKLDAIQDVADGIIYARQQAKAKKDCERIVKEVEAGLIELLQDMTGHLAAKLGRQPDGKLMVFKESSVAHFKEFVENLQAMNVTGNVTIEDLGAKAKQLLEGVDVEKLRKNESFRQAMKTQLEGLKKEIDGHVKPTGRKFAKVLRNSSEEDED